MSDSLDVLLTDDRRYPQGVPSWVDVVATDVDAAVAFYGRLFGWEIANVMPPGAPGSYFVATLDGHDVAGLAPAGDTDDAEGSRWRTYVAVDDADAVAAAVSANGGQVLAAPGAGGPGGRDAACADPAGALFSLWQARRRLGAQIVNRPGAWTFSDLHTPDPAAVGPFYAAVFGWAVDPELGAGMLRLPGYGEHLAATVDPHIHERQRFAPPKFADVVAGLVPDASAPPSWQVSFGVADRDAAATTVESLGGDVLGTSETPWTRVAVVRDPQGAQLRLSQFVPPS